jgi:hypothetical protein
MTTLPAGTKGAKDHGRRLFAVRIGTANRRGSWREQARGGGQGARRGPDNADTLTIMNAGTGGEQRPRRRRGRWSSFIADTNVERPRALHEIGNPAHRLRVDHDGATLLIHLSDEDGDGWTVLAVDRETRRWAVAQGPRQQETAARAYRQLYGQQ